ncbi:OR7G2 protein, partial [Polypterus senegalus]
MNLSSESLVEFILHCEIDAQQKSYTTPILMMIYLVTLFGNFLVILVILTNHHLQKPMYICIATLAVIDLLNSTNLIPKIVAVLLDSVAITYGACFVQMLLVLYLEGVESLLLALMACDRFVAVVFPLRYPSLVTNKVIRNVIIFLHFVMGNQKVAHKGGEDEQGVQQAGPSSALESAAQGVSSVPVRSASEGASVSALGDKGASVDETVNSEEGSSGVTVELPAGVDDSVWGSIEMEEIKDPENNDGFKRPAQKRHYSTVEGGSVKKRSNVAAESPVADREQCGRLSRH